MRKDLKRLVLGTASSLLLLLAAGGCAPDAVAPHKSSSGGATARVASKANAPKSTDEPPDETSRKASAGMATARAPEPPAQSAPAPAASPAVPPAAMPAAAPAPVQVPEAMAFASLKPWPPGAPSSAGAAAGAAGAAVGGSPAPTAGAGGMDGCIPIETRGRRRLPSDTGITVCGLPEDPRRGGDDDDEDPRDRFDDLFGGAGGAGAAGSAGIAGNPGMPSAGSGAAPTPTTSIGGTAVFTNAAAGVNLGIVLDACSPQKSYPVHIQEGTDCQGSISAGSRWDSPRGDGIPDVMCASDGTAHASYLRTSTDPTPWTIGQHPEADVLGKAVVLYDPEDPLQAIACGVITRL